MEGSISVLLLPDAEREAVLKVTLPASWRRKTVAALARTLAKKHAAKIGAEASADAVLWRGGEPLPVDATLAAIVGDAPRTPLAVSLAAPAPVPPRYPAFFSEGPIACARRDDEAAAVAALRTRAPLVVRGGKGGVCGNLVGKWTLDYLAAAASGYDKFSLHFSPSDDGAFPRVYGPGLGAGGIADTSLPDFVETARRRTTGHSVYLQIPLVHFGVDDPPKNRRPSRRCGRVAAVGDALLTDLAACDWDWLNRVAEAGSRSPLKACQLWCGDGRGRSPMHYDEDENWLCQVAGRKHVLLMGCGELFKVYAHPADHPLDRHVVPDIGRPDFLKFPELRGARGRHFVLEPGDALYIPANTLHYVYQLDPFEDNISLNFWFGDSNAAAQRALTSSDDARLRDAYFGGLPPAEAAALRRFHTHRILERAAYEYSPPGTHWGAFLTRWAEDGAGAVGDEAGRLARALSSEAAALLGGVGRVGPLLRDMTRGGRLLPPGSPGALLAEGPVETAHCAKNVKSPSVPRALRGK